MNPIVELLKGAQETVFINEDGIKHEFTLLPPLAADELRALQDHIPCPIPQEMIELFSFARGFEAPWSEPIDLSGKFYGFGFGLDWIFPHGLIIATDGFGNDWVVDLTSESKTWGPIFYACHDAPVIVHQTDDVAHFVSEVIRFGNAPWRSEIDDVHEKLADRIWRNNPGVLRHAACLASNDEALRDFASSLDETWEFIDLRSPKLGDGFAWGRYGPRTRHRRFGEKRIFASQKRSLGRRFLDTLR